MALAGTLLVQGMPLTTHAQANTGVLEKTESNTTITIEEAEKLVAEKAALVQEAKTLLDNYKAELARVDSALALAKIELEEAQKAYDEASNAAIIEAAKQRLEKAEAQYNLGSVGFFKEEAEKGNADAQKAYDILTATTPDLQDGRNSQVDYTQYVKVGEENSPTSLENMKKAVDELNHVNEYRAKEGKNLVDLKTNHSMMAISQYQSSYSSKVVEHAGAFNVGENLAWGYVNPFTGWYDEEKVNFETNNGKETGHYENIVNTSYAVMGYSYNNRSEILNGASMYGQTFANERSPWGTNAVSVAEYQASFGTYYTKVKTELEEARKAYENLVGGTRSADDVPQEIKDRLERAKQAYADLQAERVAAQTNVDNAQVAYDKAVVEHQAAVDLLNSLTQPDGNPGETPDGNPGETPDGNPGETPDGNPGETPDGNPGETPEVTPGEQPGGNVETTPEVQPETEGSTVNTGVSTNMVGLLCAMIASMFALVTTGLLRKKK